jgi:hypothetical protein
MPPLGSTDGEDPDAMNLLPVILHGSKIKTRTKAASMPAFSGSPGYSRKGTVTKVAVG